MTGSRGYRWAWLSAGGPALAVPLAVTLAGCGSGGVTATGTQPSAAATAVRQQPVAAAPASHGPGYGAAGNARKDIAVAACRRAGSRGWMIKGTATNSSAKTRGYTIVVNFVAHKGKAGTVLDTKIVTVRPIHPRASARWSAVGAAGHARITCVVRQARA